MKFDLFYFWFLKQTFYMFFFSMLITFFMAFIPEVVIMLTFLVGFAFTGRYVWPGFLFPWVRIWFFAFFAAWLSFNLWWARNTNINARSTGRTNVYFRARYARFAWFLNVNTDITLIRMFSTFTTCCYED